jgi:voltage-gated potassium channel
MEAATANALTHRRRYRRGDLTAFVGRHHLAWEVAMGVLALGYLAVSFLVDEGRGVWPGVIAILGAVFVIEFATRFLDAPSRASYLRHHWLDLVSAVPLIGGLRSLRLLRLLRLGAAIRVIGAAEEITLSRGGTRESFWYLGPSLIVLWFGAASACWLLEHGVNPNIQTFLDALYWAFITATTIGYGNVAPVTPAGHILAGVVIFVGIGLVGILSAQLTQRWLRAEERHHPRLMLEKMTRLEDEIASLKDLLIAARDGQGTAESEGPSIALGSRASGSATTSREPRSHKTQ